MQLVSCVILVILSVVQISQSTTEHLWTSWKYEHQKSYSSESEEVERRTIWSNNFRLIQEHNMGNHSYTLALNHLADMVIQIIIFI